MTVTYIVTRDRLGHATGPEIKSLAVLPFGNLSRDPDQEFFSDGLTEEDESFLVMEYVEGETLRARLLQRFTLAQCLDIAAQCTDALNAAHQNGIVHSDIKPENIMLTPAGQVKILDFGVAKHVPRSDQSTTMDRSRRLSGTSGYMAPEVLLEMTPDGRAEIFSLGIVFYEVLTGRHPFSAGSFVATSERILHESPPPITRFNPEVPTALRHIITRMYRTNLALSASPWLSHFSKLSHQYGH